MCTRHCTDQRDVLASYPGVRGEGRRKRTPGAHCLRMRLISEKSRKIGYFGNPPCNVDVNFNFSRSRSTCIMYV